MTRPLSPLSRRITGLLLALCLVPLPGLARAEPPPTWWPAEMALPADSQIEKIHEVGARIRMLDVRTNENAETLLTGWADALKASGYVIDWTSNSHGLPSFEFQGDPVLNGQVVATPCRDGFVTCLQVDMTLE